MRYRRIKTNQFTAWIFSLAILSQYVVDSPVLCLEFDGQINIETDCVNLPIPENNEHQDNCFNCVDIPFWNYNPYLTFLTKVVDFDFDYYQINQQSIFHGNYSDVSLIFQSIENPQTSLQPFLKYTVLIL